jgi:N-carbamoylputrescine amidase
VPGLGIGVAQIRCQPLDVPANIDTTTAAIRTAAAHGAQLVVLPELASTGYVLDRDQLLARAEPADAAGAVTTAWAEAARECRVTVVGGLAERSGAVLYNSVVVLGPGGDIVGCYRKLHLFGREREVFAPGDLGLPVIELDGLRLGILVCYDLRFPEALRILAVRGVDVVAVPTAWVSGFDAAAGPNDRIGQVDGALVQANLSSVFVACADQVGSAPPFAFLGRSLVVDPYGRPVLGPLSPVDPSVSVVQVDLDEVPAARNRGPGISPLADRRTDVYGELLGYQPPTEVT